MDAEARGTPRRDPRPRSAVSTAVGIVGLAGLLGWTAIARYFDMVGPLAAGQSQGSLALHG